VEEKRRAAVTSGVPYTAVTSGVPSGSLFSLEPFPLPLPSQSIFGRLLEPHGSRVHFVELTHNSIIVTMCTHQNSAFRAGLNVLICKSLWDNLRSYIGEQRCICHWSTQLAVFHENCNGAPVRFIFTTQLESADSYAEIYQIFFCYVSEFENLYTILPAIWNMHTHRHIYCVYHCVIVFV